MVKQIKNKLNEEWQQQSAKVKDWWSRLSLQEKKIAGFGGAIVSLFLFYVLIWSPMLGHLNVMRKRIKSGEQTLVWMQAADKKIQSIESHNKTESKEISPVALMSVLQKEINQNSLGQSLEQLKQASNDTIELDFKQVEFDKVIVFLTKTLKEYRVTVDQFSVTAVAKPGMVDVQLMLKI